MGITSKIKSIISRRKEAAEARRVRAILDEHNSSAASKFPELAGFHSSEAQLREQLRADHEYYVGNVSSEKMALSLNCAVFLDFLVREVKPARVLDLGSGFSSYVLRRISDEFACVVYSVDDNREWLEKTRVYLQSKNVSTDNLMYWEEFNKSFKAASETEKFDVVFHDLGSMETRKAALRFVLQLTKPGGLVILDDMHKSHYFKFVEDFLSENPEQHAHLEKLLLDNHGRWSTILRKS